MERAQRCSAASLTEDLMVEILSRVPVKPLCRFKCVSKAWENLISHPEHRKKLPQTLAGFLYTSLSGLLPALAFTNASPQEERYPIFPSNFSFLPEFQDIRIMDCCNGLLLCRRYDILTYGGEYSYLVCNPATEKWVQLPDSGESNMMGIARLGFEPGVSLHFYVFELEQDRRRGSSLNRVAVYSSETGRWIHKYKGWNQGTSFRDHRSATVFLNGYLHFDTSDSEQSRCLAAVDTKGETWKHFSVPAGGLRKGYINQSQGCLHYANFQRGEDDDDDDDDAVRLVVYILENYGSKEWTLKHSVESSYVFGGIPVDIDRGFDWIAIHPNCNSIFFTLGQRDTTFMCYNMDLRQAKVIPFPAHRDDRPPYLPYVPVYSELQPLHT